MNKPIFCQSGVNLGGWISQYETYRSHNPRHFETFVTAADIRQIASWGMDHVRLPVDYPVLEDDARPFEYKESGFEYIENCLEWCRANGLALILDLHKAPGYSFDDTIEEMKPMPLFTDAQVAERFYRLWEAIARRFAGRHPHLHFELLNEVNLPNSDPWNAMIAQAVARIRAIEASRTLLIGSNNFCVPETLKDLAVLDDPHIVYTFHSYEPLLFTHQKAAWVPQAREFNQALAYPGPYTGLAEFLERTPHYHDKLQALVGTTMDSNTLEQVLAPAIAFQQATGQALYCGEYGVIEHTDPVSRRNWHRDFIAILRQAKIGRAVWSYKRMGFGLVDYDGSVMDPELIDIVRAA
ncbi:MAG: glycoside hydrolase family 5 protein [Chloroflexota bacterium]